MSELRFDGEVAIVTGAGHGLGRGDALERGARGAAVVCNDIDAAAAESCAAEIVQRGGSAVAETSSVASPDGGRAIAEAAVDTFGSVEIVVNNAGQLRNGPFEDVSVEDFEAVVRTHLMGAFYITQPAYRLMKAAGYGRIIFTSSAAGMFGLPWQANYAAAKAGVAGLCKVVALEGEPHGIKANAILPMALNTHIGHEGRPPFAPQHLEEMMRAFKPLAKYMTVDNVVPLVVYLASRECTVTQRMFSVGAGHVAEVFVGTTRGWYAPDLSHSTPEEVGAHLDAASDRTGFGEPQSGIEELHLINEHIPTT